MHCDTVSQTSSLVSNERQLVLQLLLTTLFGEEHKVIDAGIHTIGEAAWQHCNR